jgi:K+-sensing histidine kinase KdpD
MATASGWPKQISSRRVPLPLVSCLFTRDDILFFEGVGASVGIALFRKLAEEDVTRRTAELESAARGLETLNRSISRDLRTPLATIDGYLRVILREEEERLDENTRRHFTAISDNVQTMQQRIDDLLSPSC